MVEKRTFRLLVVDDNAMNRDMLSRRLKRSGYMADVAEDGNAALRLLESDHFDLVLLDIMMPGMDGHEVLERMKGDDRWRHIPVIMLTAVQEKAQVVSCLKRGADNYVVKPFDMDVLKARIEEALAKSSGKQSGDESAAAAAPQDVNFEALLRRLRAGDIRFPTLPDVAFKVVGLFEREDVSLDEIAATIKVDPAISAAVIRLANTAFYRGVSPVSQVEDALARIGLNRITQSLMPIVTAGMFNSEAPLFHKLIAQVWRHSLATGVYAKLIGRAIGYPNPEMLFSLGMFHDIGQLFLIEVLQELSNSRQMDDEEKVQALLDKLHVPFGQSLVSRWELPRIFVNVVGQHHRTAEDSRTAREAQIISLADDIAYQRHAMADLEQDDGGCELPEERLVPIGLKPELLKQLIADASAEIAAAEAAI